MRHGTARVDEACEDLFCCGALYLAQVFVTGQCVGGIKSVLSERLLFDVLFAKSESVHETLTQHRHCHTQNLAQGARQVVEDMTRDAIRIAQTMISFVPQSKL